MKKLKFILKQFPFVFPKRLIQSACEFIDNSNKNTEWYNSKRSFWYVDIEKEEMITNALPKTIEKTGKAYFSNNIAYKTYNCSLFYLYNSFIYGNEGFVLTNYHSVFQEFVHFFNTTTLRKYIYTRPFKFFTLSFTKINGTAAILLSPQSHNFYHWFSDVLPRIRLYEPVIAQIDYFCVADDVPDNFLAVLPLFGIDMRKIFLVKRDVKVQFDKLYIASLPGSEGRSAHWAIEYLRNKLLGNKLSERKIKYYLKRGNANERHIVNEDEIITFLKREGFEVLDTGSLSIEEQIDKMRLASIVISMHGAALTNLIFTPEGCRIIEIHTYDYFRTDCYYTLSAMRNLPYWYLIGEKTDNGKWGDIILPVKKLKQTIEACEIY